MRQLWAVFPAELCRPGHDCAGKVTLVCGACPGGPLDGSRGSETRASPSGCALPALAVLQS